MLPKKVWFRFVFAKYVFGYLRDISHFVTHEVTTAKPVQTLKNYKTYADLDNTTWKDSSKK